MRPDSFAAPPIRFTDEHPANGTGWLIASGGPAVRLQPAGLHALVGGAGTGLMLGLLQAASFAGAGLGPLEALAILPGLLAAVAATSLGARFVLRHRLTRAPLAEPLAGREPGSTVRVVGTIAAQETMTSLFGQRPAVLCRSRVLLADETRGIDFWLVTRAGERLRVFIRGALMLDRPTGTPDDETGLGLGQGKELCLGPGDEIEVCGQLHRQAGPDGEGSPGRGTPLCWSLRAPRGGFLLVRRCRPRGA